MSVNRVLSFIGLAKKAGAVAAGEFAVEDAVKRGKASLVIIASDASSNTSDKTLGLCGAKDVKTLRFGSKNELGNCLGREMFSVIALTDKRFSDRLEEMIVMESNRDNTIDG
jgi:ribosomal protein L7Ae-like RNA K-turn-binding protein